MMVHRVVLMEILLLQRLSPDQAKDSPNLFRWKHGPDWGWKVFVFLTHILRFVKVFIVCAYCSYALVRHLFIVFIIAFVCNTHKKLDVKDLEQRALLLRFHSKRSEECGLVFFWRR